jgi:isopentenyldiphosphate isomerase
MKFFSKVYRLQLKDEALRPDGHEVSELQWFSVKEVKKMMAEHPETVTHVLREVVRRYY